MAVVCRIRDLTKNYKGSSQKANDCLSFDINEGEIFGLLGPNGAGKSTLINQVAGLIRPSYGSISLFGLDIVKNPHLVPGYIALQPQHSIALANLYPEEAIYHTAMFRGMKSAEARNQTNSLMEELSLDSSRKKRIASLSGGQQKLVTLAVAFTGNRAVQIFDEPTNELDPKIRRIVWDKLLQRNRQGSTIILVTHNVLEAERVIQRVGIINQGRLMALGTPGELKAHVDQRVRLDILFKIDVEIKAYTVVLQELGQSMPLSPTHWTVLCDRDTIQRAINRLLTEIGLDKLDDFRILTPSLEDVYLQLGGGVKLG
jgi:ABC-2 type transport system ATP-binding protein